MKKTRIILFMATFILIILFLLGPRVPVDTTLEEVELPDDLDQYLQQAEAAYDDIVPNTEKTILWAGENGARTPFSVVYLHGFSATRQETAPLADEVAAALAEATVNDWLNDAYEALAIGRRLGERVILMATSTGGSAASWLVAQRQAADLAALVLISPNFAVANKASQILTWPWGTWLATLLLGEECNWEVINEGHGRYWTNCYPTRALLPMQALVALAKQTAVDGVKTPLLLLYSPNDQVVSPAAAEAFFARYGAARKELVAITETDDANDHVIAGDVLSRGTTGVVRDHIVAFIGTIGGQVGQMAS
jgi:esterase/lipase